METLEAQFFSEEEYKAEVAKREAADREANTSKGDAVDDYIDDLRAQKKYPEENLRGVESDIREQSKPYDEKQTNISGRIENLMKKVKKPLITLTLLAAAAAGEYSMHETQREELAMFMPKVYEELALTEDEQKLADIIRDSAGEDVIKDMEKLDSVKSPDDRSQRLEEATRNDTEAHYFQSNPAVTSNEDVKDLVRAFPPMYRSNLKEVTYEPWMDSSVPANYTRPSEEPAQAFAFADTARHTIKVTGAGTSEDVQQFTELYMAHELGHHSDWRTNKTLTLAERERLFVDVLSRVRAQDRFFSSEVEDINDKDKKVETRWKTDEYFASINAAYFSKDYVKLPQKDRMIIERLNKLVDPNFKRDGTMNNLRGIENVVQKKNLQRKAMYGR